MNIKIIGGNVWTQKICTTSESRLNKSKKFLGERMRDLMYITV